mgnify:CR=1 FL=1
MFVLVLGLGVAFCGGVNAFMQTLNAMLHWTVIRLHPAGHHRAAGWGTILPTCELGVTLLGVILFFSLCLPFVFQVVTEFEICNFASVEADMAVQNEKSNLQGFMGTASLLAVACAETGCLESRPHLLLATWQMDFSLVFW